MSENAVVVEEDEITYMTSRTDKAGLRAGLLEAHAFVEQTTTGLDIATLEGEIVAGEWTIRDIVGHLADWDMRNRRGIEHVLGGPDPGDSTVDDFDALNGQMVAVRRERGDRWSDVTRDLADSLDATLVLLAGRAAGAQSLAAAG